MLFAAENITTVRTLLAPGPFFPGNPKDCGFTTENTPPTFLGKGYYVDTSGAKQEADSGIHAISA